ncbi:MAG TPA: tetratricopeptide repeat protein [Phycisphaerae bacterium]|nr:tetratricopeptide repeat protein [Phycisphaerae bacterium]
MSQLTHLFQLAANHYYAGRLHESEAACVQMLQVEPRFAPAYGLLGILGLTVNNLPAAEEMLLRAIEIDPRDPDYPNNLGTVYKAGGRVDDALAAYRQALAICPPERAALAAGIHGNICYVLNLHPDADSAAILAAARAWEQRFAGLSPVHVTHPNSPDPDRRLRIGYVSPDFRDHTVGWNLLPLFRQHDHGRFEIFCYANGGNDALTADFRSCADRWHDIGGMSDDAVVNLVRGDGIDILIDLALHTSGGRLLVFSRKPAPVQATFAGYPGTTGLAAIDYRLTDPLLDPPGCDGSYAEKSLRLPGSFWCYAGFAAESTHAVGNLPALATGAITFGCLNNFSKVHDGVLHLWAAVLREVPGSRLLLLAPRGAPRERVVRVMESHDVTHDRIDFADMSPRQQYLRLYDRIDIGLDTFPYNGHTTSLDAFWMGVPVVTRVGRTVVGRAGLSQLTHLGLPELIAQSDQEFVRIAVQLARDLPRLATMRAGLRGRMLTSILMDAGAFARGIEDAYIRMWHGWCASSR